MYFKLDSDDTDQQYSVQEESDLVLIKICNHNVVLNVDLSSQSVDNYRPKSSNP